MATNAKKGNYKVEVLEVNNNFKQAIRTVNKGLKILLASEVLTPQQTKKAKDILKSDESYKDFCSKVRTNKNGTVVVFYILQALYREVNK
jgi:hypothetical protein